MTPPRTKRASTVLLIGALALLSLSGCAPEPAPADDAAAVETATPTPEIRAGDLLTAAQAAEINAADDLIRAYPVASEFYAVKWGEPIPEAVLAEVDAQVKAGAGESYGTMSDRITEDWVRLSDTMKQESEKLGGSSIAAVQCALSFSTVSNAFEPTWVISEPGPVGQYESQEAALARAEGWAQDGKKMYVVIDNLGC